MGKKKRRKEKKIGNRPPPPESSLCSRVPGVLLALQIVTTGPICVKVSQWQLQLRMRVVGSDLSPQGACTPRGGRTGEGESSSRVVFCATSKTAFSSLLIPFSCEKA